VPDRPETPDPRQLLAGWLRRAAASAAAERLVLRGSLPLAAWCPARARLPADVDYLVPGQFDPDAAATLARAIAALPDERGGTTIAIDRTELTWIDTPFPGVRAHARGRGADGQELTFHVDFGFGDPLAQPPAPTAIDGVGDVLACTPEVLFGWKLHGLVELGPGRWRAKDLYDLELLWTSVPLERTALRPSVELAFGSRGTGLAALDDLRTRAAWGTSRTSARKWRSLARRLPAGVALPTLTDVRDRVRGALDEII
jgi:hypothetical protein